MLGTYVLSPGTKLVPWLLGLYLIVGIVGVETIDWSCVPDIMNALCKLRLNSKIQR